MTEATEVLTLTGFLLARIAEDEAEVAKCGGGPWFGYGSQHTEGWDDGLHVDPPRARAECEAKRQIVEECEALLYETARSEIILRHLAAVYADHPGYRDEWRPF